MLNPTVHAWLGQFVATALAGDLQGHMAMISKDILVFGVPGFDAIGYEDWFRQCEHEFPQGLIKGLEYTNTRVQLAGEDRIMFRSLETSRTSDGRELAQAVEMLLEREDSDWRLKQLRILSADEARHHGL